MTYEEARSFIKEANQYGIVLGLTSITELLRRLGNPQDKLKVIHIAGTNGKGSVGAFLTSILSSVGYKVGRYVSPAVYSYREIIQISGRYDVLKDSEPSSPVEEGCMRTTYITREGIEESIKRIKPICKQMVEDGFSHPTSFEIETAMTFIYLLEKQVDYLILEAGMGGRLDATNVIKCPVCVVITSISMDHMQYLGGTLEEIATEKAGIIKAGCPVITCKQSPEVLNVIDEQARKMKSPLLIANTDNIGRPCYSLDKTRFSYPGDDKRADHGEYQIGILGRHQISNAIIAIETARALDKYGHPITNEAIEEGLIQARWNGRFEKISRAPDIYIDGAHNEAAALSLRDSIEIYFTNRRLIFMIGVLADKDYQTILRILAPLADVIVTVTPDNERALASDRLAMEARAYCKKVLDGNSIDNALKLLYNKARSEDVILAFGSLSFLGELTKTINLHSDSVD